MKENKYVHGYSDIENTRLRDQALTLTDLLHHDTEYPAGHKVLEVGCGVGAQTITLATISPNAQFTSIDVSESSLKAAEKLILNNRIKNVSFQVANLFNLPFKPESFNHIFVCFVLEHVQNPLEALKCLIKVLKKGGSITVYADSSLPHMVEGFTRKTFNAMMEGVKQQALDAKLIDDRTWEKGIKDLYKTADDDGTFCYTFFKAVALK